jgi:hypothetical protein
MLAILGVGAASVIAGWLLLTLLASPSGRAAVLAGDRGQERPAMVNFVLTNCTPGAAAYQATILDLAARGFLAAAGHAGQMQLALVRPNARVHDLTGYERQVLGDARARLADTGGAPFAALADACTVDVRGTWEPFQQKLLAEAKERRICRQMLPATGWTVLLSLTATAVIAAVTFLTAWAHRAAAAHGPVYAPIIAVIVFWCGLGWLERQHRLTAAGSALADRWKRERAGLAAAPAAWDSLAPAALQRRAFAVAAGIPQASPGSPAPVAPGAGAPRRAPKMRGTPPVGTQRPAEAWSSFSGNWRLVKTGKGEGMGMGGGVAMLGLAALLAIVAYALSGAGGTGSWPLGLGAAAVLAGVAGARRLVRLSSLPAKVTFDGQVIARWHEESSSENGTSTDYYISVDDGQRGWTFSGHSTYDRVALGDLVRVTVNPRSRGLIELSVTGRPRTDLPGPPRTEGPGPPRTDLPGPPRTEPFAGA